MNNVILSLEFKDQDYGDKHRIIYAYWVAFDSSLLHIHHNYKDTEHIPLKEIQFVSIVGQFDKYGKKYHHHLDPNNKPGIKKA